MISSLIKMIFGIALTLFIPGFALTLILFPTHMRLNVVERIALGSVLSIAILLLTAIFLDFGLGIDFTGMNMNIALISLTLLFILIWLIQIGKINLF